MRESTNPKDRHKMTSSHGVVVKYNNQKATFRIRYQGFDRKMDVEDVDMSTLEDILTMGPKYGDQRVEWGRGEEIVHKVEDQPVIFDDEQRIPELTPRKGGDSGECRKGD
jgi:hypothetical protein